jgi:hypothetical protein
MNSASFLDARELGMVVALRIKRAFMVYMKKPTRGLWGHSV